MNVIKTELPGVIIFEPTVFGDDRGYFLETYNADRYKEAGISENFIQDNLSFSRKGILRGLHYQTPMEQGKLVQVIKGEVYDVAVDVRAGSPTFGQWYGSVLSESNKRQIYVPAGFAHGFVVTSDTALFSYKCTELYNPTNERRIAWNDTDLAINWPITDPLVSEKDQQAVLLKDLQKQELPSYE